jgi:hypothetical protein
MVKRDRRAHRIESSSTIDSVVSHCSARVFVALLRGARFQ